MKGSLHSTILSVQGDGQCEWSVQSVLVLCFLQLYFILIWQSLWGTVAQLNCGRIGYFSWLTNFTFTSKMKALPLKLSQCERLLPMQCLASALTWECGTGRQLMSLLSKRIFKCVSQAQVSSFTGKWGEFVTSTAVYCGNRSLRLFSLFHQWGDAGD